MLKLYSFPGDMPLVPFRIHCEQTTRERPALPRGAPRRGPMGRGSDTPQTPGPLRAFPQKPTQRILREQLGRFA